MKTLARDGEAVLEALEDEPLPPALGEAAALLATVLGKDLEAGPDGRLRIARRVAPDRVISTVDPDARHGHKTSARGFDGYKGHVALDPDAELVTAIAVTPGNAGDAAPDAELVEAEIAGRPPSPDEPAVDPAPPVADPGTPALTVNGDPAYGTGELLATLDQALLGRTRSQSSTP